MTIAGWILMIASNVFVLALNVFCFYRVLQKPGTPHEPPTL